MKISPLLLALSIAGLVPVAAFVGACSSTGTPGGGSLGTGGAKAPGTGGAFAGSGGASVGSGGSNLGTGGSPATGGTSGMTGGGNPDAATDASGRDGAAATSDATGARTDSGASPDWRDAGVTDGSDPSAIDVFLIGGQSNATGQGYVVNLPVGFVIDTRVILFHSGAPHLNSGAAADTWIPLRQASESPDRFGPEIGFGNHIQELYPGRKIAIIKHAHSATSLFADWAPGLSATSRVGWGPQFVVFVDTVTLGLQKLRDQGFHPVIRAMLWQQGENDADTNGVPAQHYGANLAALIGRVRAQWSTPDMLFVYGFVYPPPNVGVGRDLVRQGEANVDAASGNALAVAGAFVVATDDLEQRAADPHTPLPNDHVHFGSAGQLELGRRMAEKVHDKIP